MFAKDYRQLAWERLRPNWGIAIGAYLIYALIISALSAIGGIGTLVLGGPLMVGLVAIFLSIIRTSSARIEDLFSGFSEDFVSRMLAYILYSVFIALWSLLFVIPGIVKSYSYAMTFYIMRDNPGIGANEAITRSRQMMDGHKWQLFCLHFSFIGWILLSIVTCGIGVIFVAPYMEAANAAFYESIKNEMDGNFTQEPPAGFDATQTQSI